MRYGPHSDAGSVGDRREGAGASRPPACDGLCESLQQILTAAKAAVQRFGGTARALLHAGGFAATTLSPSLLSSSLLNLPTLFVGESSEPASAAGLSPFSRFFSNRGWSCSVVAREGSDSLCPSECVTPGSSDLSLSSAIEVARSWSHWDTHFSRLLSMEHGGELPLFGSVLCWPFTKPTHRALGLAILHACQCAQNGLSTGFIELHVLSERGSQPARQHTHV